MCAGVVLRVSLTGVGSHVYGTGIKRVTNFLILLGGFSSTGVKSTGVTGN